MDIRGRPSSYAQLDTPLLFVDSGFTVNDKTVNFSLTTNTDELAAYLGDVNKKNSRCATTGRAVRANAAAFYVTLCNHTDGIQHRQYPQHSITRTQRYAAIAAAIDIPRYQTSQMMWDCCFGDYDDLRTSLQFLLI